MQFEIKFDENINPFLYKKFSEFIYEKVLEDVSELADKYSKKYKVRESYILNLNLIKWKRSPPKKIDLIYYIKNCLVLERNRGVYMIKLDDSWTLPKSFTKVSLVIRVLEYGTDKIPGLPLIRRVLMYYEKYYKSMFVKFLQERMFELG